MSVPSKAGGNDLQVAAITETAAMDALETEWRALAGICPSATIFQTWEWNAAWWRHLGSATPGRRLHILTFRDAAEKLVGLAPLMTSFWYATPLRRLSFLGVGASDYHDLLAAPGCEDAVCDALYSHLKTLRGWHFADFSQLRVGGLLRARLPQSNLGLTSFDADGEACPFLPLPENWDALTATLGKKTRANIAYYERAMRKVYDVQIGFVQTVERLDPALDALFFLHQRRWNQRWLPGVFSSKRVQNFHRDAARRLLAQNWLRLFTLNLDGETSAALYCFAFADRICYYQGGFEPTRAKLSLGTVLTAHALQTAVAEGKKVFDFLRGDEPYKAKWTSESHCNRRRLITRSGTPFGALARRAQRAEDHIERRVKDWMRKKK